jgi:hypothetical protein
MVALLARGAARLDVPGAHSDATGHATRVRRRRPELAALAWLTLCLSGSGCVQAAQSYPLRSALPETSVTGSFSVERVEGGQRLVVVQLSELPPPERIGPGLKEFVVWLSSPSGKAERAGALAYDRAHQSGSLFATTHLPSFTLRVTGERDLAASAPSDVLLAERQVSTN